MIWIHYAFHMREVYCAVAQFLLDLPLNI